ncbi:DUF6868 family protein [Colwellia sp. MEBiC06753]
MTNINELISFFGWCSILNLTILTFSTLLIFLFQPVIIKLHSQLADIESALLPKIYFQFLAGYKVLTIVFSVVPYLALKLMS